MSIFGSIMAKVFGSHAESAAAASAAPVESPAAATSVAAPDPSAPASAAAPPVATAGVAAATPTPLVDVAGKLDGMASSAGEKLEWRTSIVDLMKLLGLDSSLASRKELAQELHYDGDTNDSAAMNVWLHKQVMTKFAENGGNVPADLKA